MSTEMFLFGNQSSNLATVERWLQVKSIINWVNKCPDYVHWMQPLIGNKTHVAAKHLLLLVTYS